MGCVRLTPNLTNNIVFLLYLQPENLNSIFTSVVECAQPIAYAFYIATCKNDNFVAKIKNNKLDEQLMNTIFNICQILLWVASEVNLDASAV